MEEDFDLAQSYEDFKKRYYHISGMWDMFKQDKRKAEEEIFLLTEKTKDLEVAAMVMEKFIHLSNSEVLEELIDFLNLGLSVNFPGSNLAVDIQYKISSKDPELDINILKNGELEPLKKAQSGGIIEVISFMLRVFVILKLNKKRVLFLDEALNGVSDLGDFSINTSRLIKQICERQKFDTLLVTHKKNLSDQAANVYIGSKVDSLEPPKISLEKAK